ncbi:MAG: NAD-dependent epimerase/dehydratase family protein [Planctomycetes bacterium]|nr:NAD-dependent epimerase/dehydratase family protein [Planctomycetota bacterium]
MKILATGAAGFIGSNVADLLIENGHDVIIVDDLSSGKKNNVNPKATFHEMDIRDPALEDLVKTERPDCIIHHAAHIYVRESVEKPLHDADINILGSIRLIEYARQYDIAKFIYVSTGGAVYGEPEYLPCDEKHPVNPICPYGASKHVPEHYLFMYRENHGLNYTVLRYPNVYGPRQDPHGEAGVVAIFTGRMLCGEDVTINGTGEQERDYLYVGDVAEANLLVLEPEKGSGEIYNLGTGVGTSVNTLFEKLKIATGYEKDAIHGPAKLGETFKIYLDAAKAKEELGWKPTVDLADGLRLTVEHHRAHD